MRDTHNAEQKTTNTQTMNAVFPARFLHDLYEGCSRDASSLAAIICFFLIRS